MFIVAINKKINILISSIIIVVLKINIFFSLKRKLNSFQFYANYFVERRYD